MKILVGVYGTEGDIAFLYGPIKKLVELGHDVSIITPNDLSYKVGKVLGEEVQVIPMQMGVKDIIDRASIGSGPFALASQMIASIGPNGKAARNTRQAMLEQQPDLLIMNSLAAILAAKKIKQIGIPLIIAELQPLVDTSPEVYIPALMVVDRDKALQGFNMKAGDLNTPAAQLFGNFIGLVNSSPSLLRNPTQFVMDHARATGGVIYLGREIAKILWNDPELDMPPSRVGNTFYTSGVVYPTATTSGEVIRRLKAHSAEKLLINWGSMYPAEHIRESIEASVIAIAKKYPWLLIVHNSREALFKDPQIGNLMLTSGVSFPDVFPLVDGVISHPSRGMVENIWQHQSAKGLPLVGVPFMPEQSFNLELASRLGFCVGAIDINNIRHEIEGALNSLFNDKVRASVRDRIREHPYIDGTAELTEVILGIISQL